MKQILFMVLAIILFTPGITAQEKSRLILKVENFSIVGDGQTDDGPALRKTI